MTQAGESGNALEAARRRLAERDADLADADRALADAIAGAHALAVAAIGRIDAIAAEVESAATDRPTDTAAGAREVARHLVSMKRELAAAVSETRDALAAKTIDLNELASRYLPR